jgi:hypothetical protein
MHYGTCRPATWKTIGDKTAIANLRFDFDFGKLALADMLIHDQYGSITRTRR